MSHYIIHTALSGATYCCVNANKSRTLKNVLVSLATHGILSSIEVGASPSVMKKKMKERAKLSGYFSGYQKILGVQMLVKYTRAGWRDIRMISSSVFVEADGSN